MLILQYGFVLTTTIISWFAVASLYLSFQVIFEAVLAVTDFGSNEFGFGFSTIYALLVLSLVIVGLAGDIRHSETFYRFVATVFGFITMMGFAAGVFLFTTFASDAFIVISVFATFGMYFLAALIHGQAVHVVGSMLQYLAMMPTYITVFTVYSFCHLNDISWGTKEGNSQSESRLKHLELAKKNADEASELDKILENFLQARVDLKPSNNPELDQAVANESKGGAPPTDFSTAPLSSVVVDGLQPVSTGVFAPVKSSKQTDNETESELGYAIVGRPPVGMGASVMSAGTRQPHLAEDVKHTTDAEFEEKMSEAGILVKMARRVLPGDQGDMIKEARKVLRAHRVAEKRALLQAKKLEVDKKEAVIEFNQFRMTMLGVWIGSNLLFLGFISNYNLLSYFALAASVLILYMGGVKLLASLLLVISMKTKICFQYCCRDRCYRADQLTGKRICCCSGDDYYYIDELWEIEQDELHGTRIHERYSMTADDLHDEERGSALYSVSSNLEAGSIVQITPPMPSGSSSASTSSYSASSPTNVSLTANHSTRDYAGPKSALSFVTAQSNTRPGGEACEQTMHSNRIIQHNQPPQVSVMEQTSSQLRPSDVDFKNNVHQPQLHRDESQLNAHSSSYAVESAGMCSTVYSSRSRASSVESDGATDLVDVLDGIDLQL